VNPLSKAWLLAFHKFVRDRNCNEGLCLDVGCGEHPIYDSCVNVDIRKQGDIQATGESLPFQNGCFNMIFCLEVIEHLTNPTKFLEEAHRVLGDNGKLILTTPNNNSCLWRLIWFIWVHTVSKRRLFDIHKNHFGLSQLRKHFKVLTTQRVNVFLHYVEAIKK